MGHVTVKIESHIIELMDLYAKKNGLSRSAAIRRAIEKFLQEPEKTSDLDNQLELDIKVLSIVVQSDLLRRLDMYAINSKRYRSEVIRAAIVNFLREEVENETVPTARVEKLTFP